MSGIIIDGKKRIEDPIINYRCCKCNQIILQSGSFDPRWPEQKEVRAVGKWDKDDIGMKEIWNPLYPGRPMALQFHLTCKYCGTANTTTVIVQHFDKNKIIADHQFRKVEVSKVYKA